MSFLGVRSLLSDCSVSWHHVRLFGSSGYTSVIDTSLDWGPECFVKAHSAKHGRHTLNLPEVKGFILHTAALIRT